MKELHRIILEPVITERSSMGYLHENETGIYTYTFKVGKNANKYEIKSAIEHRFEVQVDKIRTMVVPGKVKRVRQIAGRTSSWKKAIVKLKSGFKISEFEGV
jgi:large subunit ribosomal protein L23